jgi:hypothetical protein
MNKYAGIWLDHRKAFLVYLITGRDTFDEEPESVERIESDVERKVRLSGGSRSRKTPYGPQEIAVDGKLEDRIKRQLRQYYQGIIKKIEGADRIYIFSPGEAKVELKKEIEKLKEFAGKIEKVESADKMTHRQIAAKVRTFFKTYL